VEDLAEPAKSKGVDSVHRIIPDVDVSIEVLLNRRVDAQKLPSLGVVVAPYQLTGPARVGVGTREPDGRVAAEAARGLRIAPGAVVDRRS